MIITEQEFSNILDKISEVYEAAKDNINLLHGSAPNHIISNLHNFNQELRNIAATQLQNNFLEVGKIISINLKEKLNDFNK